MTDTRTRKLSIGQVTQAARYCGFDVTLVESMKMISVNNQTFTFFSGDEYYMTVTVLGSRVNINHKDCILPSSTSAATLSKVQTLKKNLENILRIHK